ncbi:MAG: ATP-binding protein [Acidobacteria bacterium]|nr:ATP-binding protein [Acidobacteriota bacterium]
MVSFEAAQQQSYETAEATVSQRPYGFARPLASAPPGIEGLPHGAYTCGEEHLWDELRRIDQLVRAQTLRWRLTIGESKPERLWGMVHVTDAEVERFLQSDFLRPGDLPAEIEREMAVYWQAADEIAASIQTRCQNSPPPIELRLRRIERLFSLSPFERDVLLVCLLPELDGRYRRLFGYLLDDASRTRPTVELVTQILHPVARQVVTARTAFESAEPLLAQRLIVLGNEAYGDETLPMRSLRCDDRIANYLLGGDAVDSRIKDVLSIADCTAERSGEASPQWDGLIADQQHVKRVKHLAEWWRQERAERCARATILLHGSYGSGRRKVAHAFCAAAQTPLLVADVGAALRTGDWERTVDLCFREAMLRDAAVYWAGCESLLDRQQQSDQPNSQSHHWDHLVAAAERFRGLTFFASRTAWDPANRFHESSFLRLDFQTPDYALRQQIWQRHLPGAENFAEPAPDRSALAGTLANAFQFTEGQVVDALVSARSLALQRAPQRALLTVEDLYEGCRRQSNRRLIAFAKRVEPRTNLSFDDLVLPAANKRQLEELRARIACQKQLLGESGFERRLSLGKGLIVMFTGSSGTGKTMAAELLAREQGVDLYKIDLSAVVSKYVGETEKNLSRVFSEAEDCNAMIFFDEADAIFGKRGKVEEAKDRWANIEINFLLQRVEEYSGVVILASNLRQNIDEGFLRRIHVIVEFPFPESKARFNIWRGMFPAEIARPTDEELRAMADIFRLPGGSIRNIVVDAAARALGEANGHRPAISLRHLALSTAREYQKLGKPITKGEFGMKFFDWIQEEILMNAKE